MKVKGGGGEGGEGGGGDSGGGEGDGGGGEGDGGGGEGEGGGGEGGGGEGGGGEAGGGEGGSDGDDGGSEGGNEGGAGAMHILKPPCCWATSEVQLTLEVTTSIWSPPPGTEEPCTPSVPQYLGRQYRVVRDPASRNRLACETCSA